MTEHRILLPYGSRPYLHANQRLHRMAEAKRIAKVRADVGWLAKSHRLGHSHDHITVGLEWRPRTVRGRDGNENLAPLIKACVDGLVGVGVVCDDQPAYVTRTTPVLLAVDPKAPGLWLLVETP